MLLDPATFEKSNKELEKLAQHALDVNKNLTEYHAAKAQVLSAYYQGVIQEALFDRQTKFIESQKELVALQKEAVTESKKQYKWVMSLAIGTICLAVATIALAIVEYLK